MQKPGSKQAKMLENYGLKFGANLHEIHHVARELDLPIINIVGADGVNAVTEQNAFSRPGFGMATGRMQYGRNAVRRCCVEMHLWLESLRH